MSALSRPLHGGAPAARRRVRKLMSTAYAVGLHKYARNLGLARGIAEGVRFFAPAEGRRLAEEIEEVIAGRRDPRTWRPLRSA